MVKVIQVYNMAAVRNVAPSHDGLDSIFKNFNIFKKFNIFKY